MKISNLPTIVVLCTCFAGPATPQAPTEPLTADQVIERHVDAVGGYEALMKIRSRVVRGTYTEPRYDLIMRSEVLHERPNRRLVKGEGTVVGFIYEGYDGTTMWEFYNGDTAPRIMDGEAENAGRRGAEFDHSFIGYRKKGHQVDLKGKVEVHGSPAYELEVVLNDGWIKTYYIDLGTFLVKALRKEMPLHAKGDDVKFLVTLGDYRRVGGVLFPFVWVERDEGNGGKMVSVEVIDEILINEPIDPSLFEPFIPEEARISK